MTSRLPDDWCEPSFVRDSVIWAMGSLAGAVLDRAMRDPEVQARYGEMVDLLARHPGEESEPVALVETGDAVSTVTLIARPRAGEFYLECKHSDFQSAVAFGADPPEFQLYGVFVASFAGDRSAARTYALTLAQKVRGQAAPKACISPQRR